MSAAANWMLSYYKELLIGILFVLLIIQAVYFYNKMSTISEEIKNFNAKDEHK
jgi:uncharacterized membrane protein YqhA